MWQTVKSELTSAEKYQLLVEFDQYLGLDLAKTSQVEGERGPIATDELPSEVQELLQERAAARQAKDYELADQLRDKLQRLGYKVADRGERQELFKA